MKEYEEDNLENFFRNRAEDDRYEFQEEDWDKMEAKLAAADLAAGGFSFSKFFWMALGALITSILFISYIQFTKQENGASIVELVNLEPVNPVQNEASQGQYSKEPINLVTTKITPSNSSEPQNELASVSESEMNVNSQKNDNQQVKYNNVVAGFGSTRDKKMKSSFTEGEKVLVFGNRETSETQNVSKVTKSSEPDFSEIAGSDLIPVDTIRATYQFSIIPLSFPAIERRKIDEPVNLKRFYTLGIVAGLDNSSTKESNWGTPSMRVGLSAEYFITNRLSIGAGVNISEKKYSAKGREYAPPKGFWTNGVVPETTNAICQVLDVPITISYFQPISKKSSLVFHTGMSSWFMLKEEYWYKYVPNDPDLVSWWGGENENRYWFGVLNVAVSYEYMLNDKWSLLAGPYLNMPLTGIGHGNVELRSFGIRASLRLNKYKLQNKF